MICKPLTDEDKKEICQWKYEDEYSIYNLPSYEYLKGSKSGFMNPDKENNYHVFKNGDDIIGYINLSEKNLKFLSELVLIPHF